jgi:ribose transport system ATP-binding protein
MFHWISFSGEVHALIGENGAGKSTLIKCVTGAISPDSGTIITGGNSFNAMDPSLAKQNGIEVIYQEFNLIPSLSVAENIFLNRKTSNSFITNTKEREKLATNVLQQLKIDLDPSIQVRELSPAYQQIVEIAKAISRDVKILIMDEPTAPLTVSEVVMLFEIIKNLKAKGVTIIYISHRIEELFEVADRVSILRDGKFIETKSITQTNRKDLICLMAGRQLSEVYPTRNNVVGEEIFKVENLGGNGVQNVNFNLYKSEILGFADLLAPVEQN